MNRGRGFVGIELEQLKGRSMVEKVSMYHHPLLASRRGLDFHADPVKAGTSISLEGGGGFI